MRRKPEPGVSRGDRLSAEGLQRLERQLVSSMRVADPVLLQWVRRYGNTAISLIERHGRMTPELRQAIDTLQDSASLP